MSTQFYSPSQETPNQQSPRHQGNGPSRSRFWIAIVAVGAVAVAAIIALAVTLTGSHSTTTTPGGTSSPAATSPANPATPSHPSGGGTTPAKPSAAVQKLQQELGQLNYYEGPVDGVMGPQTIAAIKDLQRQANLPQTGTMNAATTAALANYLAHGNNNMNS